MSRNTRQERKARKAAADKPLTNDSFQNLQAAVGIGAANQSADGSYGFNPVSRNRVLMEYAYRSSWICGKAVDAYAEDMTREGIELQTDLDPEAIKKIEDEVVNLAVWDQLSDTIKWARLYGGAIAVLLIDGQNPESPLDVETIGEGQFKGLLVLDRWMVNPTLQNLVSEYGPEYGKPKYYQVVSDAHGLVNMKVHHSRCIRLEGQDLPYWQRIAENGWGQSVLERLWDRLLAFDSTTQGAAQLVYKAHLRTYKVDGLRQIIAAGGKALEGLAAQIDMIRRYQSNEGLTLMDGKDEFDSTSYSFAGLSDMMMQFGQQISGAIDIPLVRLFGQSPAGLNATGESDIRLYYDGVKAQQERRLRTGIARIYDIVSRSVHGKPLPDGWGFTFKPLWQMSDTEKADIAGKVTEAVSKAYGEGILELHEAKKELKQSSEVTGIFTNITDESIQAAEDMPPPEPEELDDENQATGENEAS